MSLTFTERTGDGVATVFSFSFAGVGKGFIRRDDIRVTVDGASVAFTLQSESTLLLTPAPANGALVLIRRVMPYELPYSTWTRGNNFGQDNMNYSFQQSLYLVQEILDGYFPDDWQIRTDLNMNNHRIYNLGRPIYADDAVRLVDLQGGDSLPTGVNFLDGTSYMLIDNPLPVPTISGNIYTLAMSLKFNASSGYRVLVGETTDIGSKRSIQLNANLTELLIEDAAGLTETDDITSLGIPVNSEISLELQTKYDGVGYLFRIGYAGAYSNWISSPITGAWSKFFGAGEAVEGGLLTIYALQYTTTTLLNNWNFANQSGVVVTSTYAEYRGVLQGTQWEAVDTDDEGVRLLTKAKDVIFDPFGTNFGVGITDVDLALKDIDTNFVRTPEVDPDPDAPNGTPLIPFKTWLADSSAGARSRPLPATPAEGDEIRIRDDAGYAGINNITIGRNGKTIMGLSEDLVMTTSWSWCTLKYFTVLDDWRIVEGGVGTQVVQTPTDEFQALYPIGHVLLSVNPANPFTYLNFGTWTRVADGLFLAGIGTGVDKNGINKTLALGNNEGEWEHTITKEELPEDANPLSGEDVVVATAPFVAPIDPQSGASPSGHVENIDAWGDQAMNVTSPSFALYIWKRIF